MRKFNLQMFAGETRVKGKKIIYLYRIYANRTSATGGTIAFTTENSRSVSKDAEVVATKDGNIRTPSDAEIEITATSFLKKDDGKIKELEDAMLNDELMEIWEADLEDPAYVLTSDTAINVSKTYYTRSGSEGAYVYTKVESPSSSALSTYYEQSTTKFNSIYYQGYLTSFEKTSNAEDYTECSLTFGIDGKGARGEATVDASQQEAAAYAFADTTAATGA